jgi:hypothetical protein
MKRVLLVLCLSILHTNFLYADNNKTISDEEFMKQWEQLEKDKKEAKAKETNSRADLKEAKTRGEILDELLNRVEEIKKYGK